MATLGAVNSTTSIVTTSELAATKLDDLATPDNNTDLNVTTTYHGLTPILPNDATKYLDGTGAYSVPAGGSSGVTVQDEGTPLTTTATTLNFVGAGVTASGTGATKTITIPGSASAPAFAAYKRTTGNYTTTSTTMVSVDGTNLALTITTLAVRVQIGLAGTCFHTSTLNISFDVDIDGSLQGSPVSGGVGGIVSVRNPTANRELDCSFVWMSNVLSAGSHTFTLKWCTTGATATLNGATGPSTYTQFWVAETLYST